MIRRLLNLATLLLIAAIAFIVGLLELAGEVAETVESKKAGPPPK